MRVAVVQLGHDDDEPVAVRVRRAADLVRGVRGCDLVVLPELWAVGAFSHQDWPGRAEPVDGPTVRALAEAAVASGALVHAGSILERRSGAEGDEGSPDAPLWNTSVLLGPDGTVLARYRKIHTFGFGDGEAALVAAGREPVTVTVPLPREEDGTGPDGRTVCLGLATCYDLRFPELFRALVDRGAVAFVIPAAWPAERVGHWTLLGQARAVENQCLVIQCNTAGVHAGRRMGGRSQVVLADGEVVARAGDGEEILTVTVSLDRILRWRRRFPVLADRRSWWRTD